MYGVNLSNNWPRYALCNVIPTWENKSIFAGRILDLGSVDGGDWKGGDVGKKCRAADLGGGDISHDLVTPCMLQTSNAPNDVIVAVAKPYICMNGHEAH